MSSRVRLPPELERVLIGPDELAAGVARLGREIGGAPGGGIVLVGVLSGAAIFLADLMRAIDGPVECDFVAVSSYGVGTRSSGTVMLTADLSMDIAGRDVVLVEDIIDSGHTIAALRRILLARRPRSLRVCALLDKVERRVVAVAADYVGFQVPDEFVVGYGLDHGGLYRNFPCIATLRPRLGA